LLYHPQSQTHRSWNGACNGQRHYTLFQEEKERQLKWRRPAWHKGSLLIADNTKANSKLGGKTKSLFPLFNFDLYWELSMEQQVLNHWSNSNQPSWFALQARQRYEKNVASILEGKGYQYFLLTRTAIKKTFPWFP
jgi:hypothetical protein